MRLSLAAAAVLMLGACHSAKTREQINAMEQNGMLDEGRGAAASAGDPARPAVIEQRDELVDFHAAWPAAAASLPKLDARLRAEATKGREELIKTAHEDQAMRAENKLEYHPLSRIIDYKVAGESDRLLSLAGSFDEYTGGAHGMHGSIAILWDKAADKDVGFAGLFPSAEIAFASFSKDWCAALDRERSKRRGDAYHPAADDPFSQCPKLDDIHVIPTDKDGDGKFETLDVRADPYTAGPYAEGDYAIDLPVTATLIGSLKPEMRASFEVQRQ